MLLNYQDFEILDLPVSSQGGNFKRLSCNMLQSKEFPSAFGGQLVIDLFTYDI
jgi:hypothetical protein